VHITIKTGGKNIAITNIYSLHSPTNSCPNNYRPNYTPILSPSSHLVCGDFNSHHSSWYIPQDNDPHGISLLGQLENYACLNNPDSPTRIPYNPDHRKTSPDTSWASPDLALLSRWEPLQKMTSDHVPLLISISNNTPTAPRRTYINYNRADWINYKLDTNNSLADFDPAGFQSIDKAYHHFASILKTAGMQRIPKGSVKQYNPNFSPQIKLKISARDALKHKDVRSQDDVNRYNTLKEEINTLILQKQTVNLSKKLEELDYRSAVRPFWNHIKSIQNSLAGPPPTHEAMPDQNGNPLPPKTQANIQMKYYAQRSRLPTHIDNRGIIRDLKKTKTDPSIPPPFTEEQVSNVINKLKSGGT
jgi:hypothetical protein